VSGVVLGLLGAGRALTRLGRGGVSVGVFRWSAVCSYLLSRVYACFIAS